MRQIARMSCLEITVIMFTLSICRPEAPRLHGEWAGTMEIDGVERAVTVSFDERVLRAEGEQLPVVRAARSGGRVAFAVSRDGEELLFVGSAEGGAISGPGFELRPAQSGCAESQATRKSRKTSSLRGSRRACGYTSERAPRVSLH